MLRRKLVSGDTELSGWNEAEGVPAGKGVRGQIGREVSEGLQSDVLMWWPSIRHIPLETGIDEGGGDGSVVFVHDQVDGSESTEGFALVAQDIRRDDSNPEGIEIGGGIEVVAGVGSQVVVVEGQLIRVPEEIKDTIGELRGSVPMCCGLGGRSCLLEVISKDSVRFVWRGLREPTVRPDDTRNAHKIAFKSTGVVFLMFSVLSLES